jgi:hypothetical protein
MKNVRRSAIRPERARGDSQGQRPWFAQKMSRVAPSGRARRRRATTLSAPRWGLRQILNDRFQGRCPWLSQRRTFGAVGGETNPKTIAFQARSLSPPRRAIQIAVLLVFTAFAHPAVAQTGTILGTIDPADQAVSVALVDRQTCKKHAAEFDAASGQFTAADLPTSGAFDLLIESASALVEGIDFSVPRSDYEEEQPLSEDDVRNIKQKVASLNQFEDTVEVLAVEGNIQHAAVLVNKLRTKPFYGSKPGEIVWRVELWHFERPDETWVKVQDELFITLHRERMAKSAYQRKSVTFAPRWGRIRLSAESPNVDLGTIKLPPAEPGIRVLSEDKT